MSEQRYFLLKVLVSVFRQRETNDSFVGISRHLNLSEARYSSTKLD